MLKVSCFPPCGTSCHGFCPAKAGFRLRLLADPQLLLLLPRQIWNGSEAPTRSLFASKSCTMTNYWLRDNFYHDTAQGPFKYLLQPRQFTCHLSTLYRVTRKGQKVQYLDSKKCAMLRSLRLVPDDNSMKTLINLPCRLAPSLKLPTGQFLNARPHSLSNVYSLYCLAVRFKATLQ